MKGLVRWWNGMPAAGRAVIGLLAGGLVCAGVGLAVDWTSAMIVAGILLGAVLLFLLVFVLVTMALPGQIDLPGLPDAPWQSLLASLARQ